MTPLTIGRPRPLTKCDLCDEAASWSVRTDPRRRSGINYFACDRHRRQLLKLVRDRQDPGAPGRLIRAQSILPF